MTLYKFCCGGQNARLVAPLFPQYRTRNGKQVKFYTAIYQCCHCKELTLRGETNQLSAWTTFVEYITARQAEDLMVKAKEQKDGNSMAEGVAEEVSAA